MSTNPKPFTVEDFTKVVEAVEKSCKGIGCGYSRRECRQRRLQEQLRAWTEENRNGTGRRDLLVLTETMQPVLQNYFRDLHKHRRSVTELARYRQEMFERVPALVA